MNRKDELFQLGEEIGKLIFDKTFLEFDLSVTKKAVEARKIEIIPEGGWDGKNAEQRKASENKALFNDQSLRHLDITVNEIEYKIAEIEAQLAQKTSVRRAIEWGIRIDLTNALMKKANSASGANSDGFAFDRAMDEVPF